MDTKIEKILPEETYAKYANKLGPNRKDISDKWLPWQNSIVGSGYGVGENRQGIPAGQPISNFHGYPRSFRFCQVHYGGMVVGTHKAVIDGTKS